MWSIKGEVQKFPFRLCSQVDAHALSGYGGAGAGRLDRLRDRIHKHIIVIGIMVKETQPLYVRYVCKAHPLFSTGMAPARMESQLIGRVAAIEDDQIGAICQRQNLLAQSRRQETRCRSNRQRYVRRINSIAGSTPGMTQRGCMCGDAWPWKEDFRRSKITESQLRLQIHQRHGKQRIADELAQNLFNIRCGIAIGSPHRHCIVNHVLRLKVGEADDMVDFASALQGKHSTSAFLRRLRP
jgi:hypothetical protein